MTEQDIHDLKTFAVLLKKLSVLFLLYVGTLYLVRYLN